MHHIIIMWKCLVLVLLSSTFARGDGLYVEGVKCGVKTCSFDQYCSEFQKTCEPCKTICTQNGPNYDKKVCENSCQMYLHDDRYVTKNGDGANSGDLKGQVDKLSRWVSVNLSLTIIMLLVLFTFLCFQLYRWKDKKNITLSSLKQKFCRKKSEETPRPNNMPEANVRKGELKLDMPSNMSQSEHSPVTVTTSISRRPAEDSTLDYAYDNPALSPSR